MADFNDKKAAHSALWKKGHGIYLIQKIGLDFMLNKDSDETVNALHQNVLKEVFNIFPADITLLEAVHDDKDAIVDFRYLMMRKQSSGIRGEKKSEDLYLLNKTPTEGEKQFFVKLVKLVGQNGMGSELLQYKPENEDRWFQIQIKMVNDIVVILREEITEVKKDREKIRNLHTSLQLKGRELEQLNTELKTLTNVAATDYSETLRNLYTNLEFIIGNDAPKLSDAGKANVRRAQAAVQKLKLLTDDIIAYSKISAADGDLATINLEDLVLSVLEGAKFKIEEAEVMTQHGNLPVILGYSSLLRVLFSHLIDNAIKFRKENGRHEVHIVGAKMEGKDIDHPSANKELSYDVITISDNGIGILQSDIEKIFEMFYRVHEKKYRGSGIGLPICKKIMDIHGGFITAECIPECTSFKCFFPVKRSNAHS